MWQRLFKILEAVSLLAIIAAVGIAWYEYRGQVERSAKERSLDFVLRFQEAKLSEARRIILRPWLNYDIDKLSKSGVGSKMVDELVLKIVDQNSDKNPSKDMRMNILALVEFLDSVQACVSAKVCESDVADQLLGEFAHSFYCLYRPIIEQTQSVARLQNFGTGLQQLAGKRGGC